MRVQDRFQGQTLQHLPHLQIEVLVCPRLVCQSYWRRSIYRLVVVEHFVQIPNAMLYTVGTGNTFSSVFVVSYDLVVLFKTCLVFLIYRFTLA